MEAKLKFTYDRETDAEQETEELGDDVIARFNPTTNEIENIEVLFFSTRMLRGENLFELPLFSEMKRTG